jgi:hypothetical protein
MLGYPWAHLTYQKVSRCRCCGGSLHHYRLSLLLDDRKAKGSFWEKVREDRIPLEKGACVLVIHLICSTASGSTDRRYKHAV